MKPFWKSKTFWAILITGLIGLWNTLVPETGLPPVPDWIITVLAALGLYGRTVAQGPLVVSRASGDTRTDADRSRLR